MNKHNVNRHLQHNEETVAVVDPDLHVNALLAVLEAKVAVGRAVRSTQMTLDLWCPAHTPMADSMMAARRARRMGRSMWK